MSTNTQIEWCDKTWSPLVGCTRVSAGCDHCYAFALHDRRHIAWKRGRWPDAPAQYHQPFSRVQLLPQRLIEPLSWRKPQRVFVNSQSDLFHEDVPDEFIDQVFAIMAVTPQHTYQILTKRPQRMAAYCNRLTSQFTLYIDRTAGMGNAHDLNRARHDDGYPRCWPLPNVWLGVSIEDQPSADARIPHLLRTPAAVRFISYEPVLGPADIERYFWLEGPSTAGPWRDALGRHRGGGGFGGQECSMKPSGDIGWVIAGGESGPHARPLAIDWARNIRDQCAAAEVAFLFKQWGEFIPNGQTSPHLIELDFSPRTPRFDTYWWGPHEFSVKAGKKRAGRLLDGVEHNEFPVVQR